MKKINFINDVTKASAETFNTMQDNIEQSFTDTGNYVDEQINLQKDYIDSMMDVVTKIQGGYLIKYSNGIMKIYKTNANFTQLVDFWGIFDRTESIVETFPESFIEAPIIIFGSVSAGGMFSSQIQVVTESEFSFVGLSAKGAINDGIRYYYEAIGRWK